MNNPFLNAFLSDLLAMVQNGVPCRRCLNRQEMQEAPDPDCPDCNGYGRTYLADAELDALCAAACDGEWVARGNNYWLVHKDYSCGISLSKGMDKWAGYQPTFDGREAMRLLVKYRMEFTWYKNCDEAEGCVGPSPGRKYEFMKDRERRAIASAAVACALTKMIEGDPDG